MDNYYWDNFANEVTKDIDIIAPPERYTKIHCGDDVFVELWLVRSKIGKPIYFPLLDIAYTKTERDSGLIYQIRDDASKQHNVTLYIWKSG